MSLGKLLTSLLQSLVDLILNALSELIKSDRSLPFRLYLS